MFGFLFGKKTCIRCMRIPHAPYDMEKDLLKNNADVVNHDRVVNRLPSTGFQADDAEVVITGKRVLEIKIHMEHRRREP